MREPAIRLTASWAAGDVPLYRRLADVIATGLAVGTIGDRLPPERELAVGAGVSRSTAVAAYELLVERGVVERREGSGTFLRRRPRSGHVCEDPLACVMEFFAERA